MNIEEVRAYCLSLKGATEDMPYGPEMVVFRIEGKIFLHLPLDKEVPCMSVKLPPEYAEELRGQHNTIVPAWHLNKKHWSDIQLEGAFEQEQLCQWIRQSYDLVVSKLPKAAREKYQTPKQLSAYEQYCQQMAQAQEEEMDDDRCFPEMAEGQFVRSH